MTYISNTQDEKLQMLEAIGIKDGDVEKLFKDIPKNLRARSFNIPPGKSEYEVTQQIKGLARKNNVGPVSFLGAGYYDHFIPAAVDALVLWVCPRRFVELGVPFEEDGSVLFPRLVAQALEHGNRPDAMRATGVGDPAGPSFFWPAR